MKNSSLIPMLLLVVLLSACGPSPEQLAGSLSSTMAAVPTSTAYPTLKPYPTYTLYPTNTAYPTHTPYPTFTAAPTQTPAIVIVTPTETPTPEFTATITQIPTETKDPTMADKEAGFYLVGQDIAPGLWRSMGSGDKCYWGITTKTGDLLDNHYGMSGGTMYIPASAFQVEINERCGGFTYLGQ